MRCRTQMIITASKRCRGGRDLRPLIEEVVGLRLEVSLSRS